MTEQSRSRVPPLAGASAHTSALLLLGALVAASYLATSVVDAPVALEVVWKVSGILLIAAYALSRGARLAGAALVFSAAGDASLALDPPVFVAGMAFFGVAHLFYAAAFALVIRRDSLSRWSLPLAGLVIALSLAMLAWFLPDMGALTAPGLAYQAIITAMVALAALSKAPAAARIGAAVFMLSDTLIALGLYKDTPAPPGSIWTSYVVAQILLAIGLSRAPANSAPVTSL